MSIAGKSNPVRIGRVRFTIVAMLFMATALNYADRATLAIAAPLLSADLGIDALRMGFILSAFGWAYVIGQVPGGWLLDRFGSKAVYFWSIVTWSLFTFLQGQVGLFPAATALWGLFLLRFLVGLCEAPAFPGNARITATWFPARERGRAVSVYNSAQYFATVLFAPLMAWIAYTFGWSHVFHFMGVLGLVFAGVWLVVVYMPKTHPRLSEAELAYIADGGAMVDMDDDAAARRREIAASSKGSGKEFIQNIRSLLSIRLLWGIYIGQFCINSLSYFFITWFPIYLVQERGMSILNAGFAAVAPAMCGFIGGILGGVWSDWLLKRGHSLTVARKTPIVAGMLLSTVIVACNYTDFQGLVILFMSMAFFGKGIGALGWAVMSDTVPKQIAGLSGSVFNMFGNISSIITPIIIGYIVQTTGSFDMALLFISLNGALAIFAFLVIAGEIKRIELPARA